MQKTLVFNLINPEALCTELTQYSTNIWMKADLKMYWMSQISLRFPSPPQPSQRAQEHLKIIGLSQNAMLDPVSLIIQHFGLQQKQQIFHNL